MSKKILVADDSPTVRKLAESLLKKTGYTVLCAQEGASALGMAKTNKPDLIFWDDSLPIINGFGACEELKVKKVLKDTPVIILLTKDQMEKEKAELKRIGADGFMVKPFDPRQIVEKAQEFLNKKDTDFKEETQKELKESIGEDEKPGIDEIRQSSALPKKDKSIEILETSDIVESLEAPSGSGKTEQHGFNWFMSELRKELQETKPVDSAAEQESKEKLDFTEMTTLSQEDLEKKVDADKRDKVYQIDEDRKVPYDKLVQDLIEQVSTKLAQEVAKKIDPKIFKKLIQEEVEKLREEEIKAS